MEAGDDVHPQKDQSTTDSEATVTQSEQDQPSTCPQSTTSADETDCSESKPSLNRSQILKTLEVVERDSVAIAESFTGLFSSLRSTLSEVTSNSVDHMQCFGDAAGRLQESVLDAATKGNRYIHSCMRLNEEMKGADVLAGKLKILKRNVDALDTAVNKLLRLP
ncbi:uncharacterized protein [Euphorbia lathyris]|uniref:uncharacterized protein n=1 Tax=Euphorbia lathyris TaxID=212925 RepID=UPI003313B7D0